MQWPTWETYQLAGADANGWLTFTVSTETPMLALVELGVLYQDVRFELDNLSANSVRLYADKSPQSPRVSPRREVLDIAAASADALEFRDFSPLFWSASAAGDPDNGNLSSQVKFRLLVQKRARYRQGGG